jgi:1-deoxy-D-xylulose-5-phosphate reductoisomerase
LTFYPPDTDRFPSLRLAYEALNIGDSALIVLNASNELAIYAFAEGKIKFTDIPALVEAVLDAHPHVPVIEDVTTIYEIHEWAKRYVTDLLRGFNG